LLELGQIVIPGRHAGFDDFAASSIGALLGVSLIWIWATYRPFR
jgi:VanZ family protein